MGVIPISHQPLNLSCASCGADSPDTFKFCPQCGQPFSDEPREHPASRPDSSGLEEVAERRPVTIVFCDLVDSTELSELLDAEDYRDILKAYQIASAEALEFYSGFIAQYLGDGILAYFGYPLAFGDDATRAVNAGLEIVREVPKKLAQQFSKNISHELAIRVGIHTGTVITGEVGGGATREHLALGSAPNVAARLQGLAGKNEVIISETTRKLVEHQFRFADMGTRKLKGIKQHLEVFQIIDRIVSDDLDTGTSGHSTMVGRKRELNEMLDGWQRARQGQGQLVYISGEPGIGKSTLTQAFAQNVSGTEQHRLVIQGSPYHQSSAFHPLVSLLLKQIPYRSDKSETEQSDYLRTLINEQCPSIYQSMEIILELMSMPYAETSSNITMAPAEKRARFKSALIEWVWAMAQTRPVSLLVEDAHYLDPSTVEWLTELSSNSTDRALMVIITSRPEGDSDWKRYAGNLPFTILNLKSLANSDSERIILDLTAGKTLPTSLKRHLISQTGGNPLFIRQLFQSLVESGLVIERPTALELSGPLEQDTIPSTLQASLMARLDSLGDARKLAGLAATAGPAFSKTVLQQAADLPEHEFQQQWNQLLAAEVVGPTGTDPDDVYTFTHGLIRDSAYQSLLRRTRRTYHKKFAELLQVQDGSSPLGERGSEILAFHFTEAGIPEMAIPLWKKAGEEAIHSSAHVEAREHFSKALALLESGSELASMPPPHPGTTSTLTAQTKSQLELDIRLGLAVSLFATVGPASAESISTYESARKLCELTGEKAKLSPVLIGLWLSNLCRVQLTAAADLAEQVHTLAIELEDPTAQLYALIALGNTAYNMGNFVVAKTHLDRAEAMCDDIDESAFRLRYGLEPRIQVGMFLTHINWFLGQGDAASQRSELLRAQAREQGNPLNVIITHYAEMIHQQHRRDVDLVHVFSDQTIELASAENAVLFLGAGLMYKGWVQGMRGQHESGLRLIESGYYDHLKPASGDVAHSFFSLLSGEVNLAAGKVDAGLEVIERGIVFAERHRDLTYVADLYRTQGALLAAADEQAQALAAYERAIKLASEQSAKLIELRARAGWASCADDNHALAANAAAMQDLLEAISGGMTVAESMAMAAVIQSHPKS